MAAEALDTMTKASVEASEKGFVGPDHPATELPCNVFGTVDRCDGMACEHDGNCFSGCCSLFVSGDQKRCMPLVGGDLCPIAIDVVEKFQIVGGEEAHALEEHHDIDHDDDEYDSPLHYIDHKEVAPELEEETSLPEEDVTPEDHPIVEKGEHGYVHDDEDLEEHYGVYPGEYHDDYHIADAEDFEPEHYIPVKHEHHQDERFWDLEEDYEDADHEIPIKDEHEDHDVHYLPKDVWRPDFHARGDYDDEDYDFTHHYMHGENELEDEDIENESKGLTPKTPEKDDPRLKIPAGKSTASHDHVIVPKDPIPSEEHRPRYGQAYEHERKQAIRGTG